VWEHFSTLGAAQSDVIISGYGGTGATVNLFTTAWYSFGTGAAGNKQI
jgi:hypothetical protein